jgi:hypothetical protein
MKLYTQRDAIRESVDLFCRNYPHGDILFQQIGSDNLTAEQFDRITGTTGWCSSKCDECFNVKEVLVEIGESWGGDPDFRWVRLCYQCLTKATRLIDGEDE